MPVAITLPGPEPDNAPMNALAMTAVYPAPPRMRPIRDRITAIQLSAILVFVSRMDMATNATIEYSKEIQNMEKDLGVQLFDRKRNPLSLTPAGEYFVRNARELLYKEEQLRKGLDRFQSGEYGRLTIGATPFRSFYLMPEVIKKIRERFPNVQVTLREVSSALLRVFIRILLPR